MSIFQDFLAKPVDYVDVSDPFLDFRAASHFPFRDFFHAKKFAKIFSFQNFQVDISLDIFLRKTHKQAFDHLCFSSL